MFLFVLLSILSVFARASYPVAETIDSFEYDGNSRLLNHQLLYHGNELCEETIEDSQYLKREVKKLGEPLLSQFLSTSNKNESSTCYVVCLERGVHYNHVLNPLLDQVMSTNDPAFGHLPVVDWVLNHCQSKEVGFLSYLSHDTNIYWINGFTNNRVQIGTIQPGEKNTVWIGSYLGHKFILTHAVTQKVVGEVEVEFHTLYSLGAQKSGRKEHDVRSQVASTFDAEWQRAHRVTRTFTEFGFHKGRLPNDLFASMSAYYYNNRDQATLEEWEDKGIFVNWWEADVFFLPMPMALKRYWQARLQQLVEAWVGIPLELTDIYGMRRYEDGARLLTHVDREHTHAASLIVNVAQGGIRQPWNIEIYDFADRLHEIEMNEGDIVFYESARCLHGRMQPLQGAFYVNLFAHYRPTGDPLWFTRPNPEGNAEQALDLGTCRRNGSGVDCDGAHDAPFLSPRLDQLRGPADLYSFWEEAGRAQTAAGSEEL